MERAPKPGFLVHCVSLLALASTMLPALRAQETTRSRETEERITVRILCANPGVERGEGDKTRVGREIHYAIGPKKVDDRGELTDLLRAMHNGYVDRKQTVPTLELAPGQSVLYGEVAEVVDIATALGFERVRFSQSLELSPAWQGEWSGTSKRFVGGMAQQEFATGLKVRLIEERCAYTWVLSYGDGDKRQDRNYELRHGLRGADHFVIDENNGILLDTWLTVIDEHTQELVSRFDVMGNVIEARYTLRHGTLRKDTIEMQLTTFTAEPVRESGGEDVPKVQAYRLKSVQRALLRRS